MKFTEDIKLIKQDNLITLIESVSFGCSGGTDSIRINTVAKKLDAFTSSPGVYLYGRSWRNV